MREENPITTEAATKLLLQAAQEKFYGIVAFQLRAGQIVLVRREETLTSRELNPRRGAPNDYNR